MQATLPPGAVWPGAGAGTAGSAGDDPRGPWSPWAVRKVMDELYRRRDHSRAHYVDLKLGWPKIAVYTVGRDGHAIRIDNTLGRAGQDQLPSAWFNERYLFDPATWRKSDLQRFHVESPAPAPAPAPAPTPAPAPAPGSRSHARHDYWDSATRGWLVGALLLALLICLVRAAEKCLDRRLFKRTRRQSDEWPRPNVLATSQQHQNEIVLGSLPGMDESTFPTDSNRNAGTDLPPPYSECANNEANANMGANKLVITLEEPPPPYSACYVSYSNPKDGIPSVHFFNRRRQSLFDTRQSESGPSFRSDTQITPIVSGEGNETETTNTENGCFVEGGNSNSEYVFENGRIVEREECINNVNVINAAGTSVGESQIPKALTRDNGDLCHVVCIQDSVSSGERVISA